MGAILLVAIIAYCSIAFIKNERMRAAPYNALRMTSVAAALDEYHYVNGCFPPAVIKENGKPPYSWRVAILPYLPRDDLYQQYRFDEPWDSPTNRELLKSVPWEYIPYPELKGDGVTNLVAVIDRTSIFPPNRYAKRADIKDDFSRTIIAVQVPKSDIPWTEPRDLNFDEFVTAIRATSEETSGRVRFVTVSAYENGAFSGNESTDLLRALITIAGHDNANPFFVERDK
jgi:hypothetical protein